MVIKGYLDESEDDEWFTFGGIFSTGMGWTWLNTDWQNCLERWNKKLNAQGRKKIRRFHSTDWATGNEDFEGWSLDEKSAFRDELHQIIEGTGAIHSVSFSLRPAELMEVFKITDHNRKKRACYQVLLQYLMLQFGSEIHSRNPGYEKTTVVLVHDHTKFYDEALNRAFYEYKEDPGFRYSRYFTTISPMTWEDCVPLQPADMVIYETRKQTLRNQAGFGLEGEIKKLLDLPSFGGSAFYFRKDNLEELRVLLDEIKYELGTVPPTPKKKK